MSPDAIAFGPFEIDLHSVELRRDGVRVPLEPLPVRILARLATDAGALVDRNELLELGWSERPWVAEQSLNTCVYEIRKALTASGPPAVRIETLRGRGYRLSTLPRARPGAAPPEKAARLRPPLAALALASVTALALMSVRSGSEADLLPSEAVHFLDRARYLALETRDLPSARAVLDSGLVRLPDVAELHAEWAEVSAWLGELKAADAAAARALTLDPRSTAAHRTRGMLALLRRDWTAADSHLQRALAADRGDGRTLTLTAYFRVIEGRFDEADRLIQEALEADPLSATIHQDAGLVYLLMGRYSEADRFCGEVLRLRPRSAWAVDCLFDSAVLGGRPGRAAAWGRRLLELADAPTVPDTAAAPEAVVATVERWRLGEWMDAVGRGAYPFGLALAYAANEETDEAIAALLQAAGEPRLELLTLAVDPRLAPLRDDPAFRRLQSDLGLPG